jgi:anti-anti-sigma factor
MSATESSAFAPQTEPFSWVVSTRADNTATTPIPPAWFSIQSRSFGVGTRLVVSGELDCASDTALREALTEARPGSVELDLGAVSFMGCSTLNVLLDVNARRGGAERVSITVASRVVRRLLDVAGLEHLLDLHRAG